MGDLVGHYEGNSLVIDAVGIMTVPVTRLDRRGTPHSDVLHVVGASWPPFALQFVAATRFASCGVSRISANRGSYLLANKSVQKSGLSAVGS
jgi:hypothetical protein